MMLRRVVARSSGIGSNKRAWMKPPTEVENPRKPTKPRVADQIGLIASAAALAAATACATAFEGAAAPGANAEATKPQVVLPTPSTPEPANPAARVSASSAKPARADVAGPRSPGQRPWGDPGSSTYGMPKSVNMKVLAPGSRSDAADSGAAIHGLGDITRSPMSKGRCRHDRLPVHCTVQLRFRARHERGN